MHAKDTPFEFLIHEISNISGPSRPRAAAAPDLKITTLSNALMLTEEAREDFHCHAAASNLTTKFAGRTTWEEWKAEGRRPK
jgi:hypothetical protein